MTKCQCRAIKSAFFFAYIVFTARQNVPYSAKAFPASQVESKAIIRI